MTDEKQYSGHLTHADGAHTSLSHDEAKALWDAVEDQKRRRAELMPASGDALSMICTAKERMREPGWQEAKYCPKDGEEFAVIEWGCSGIFPAVYHGEWPTGLLYYCDSFTNPAGCMFKPLADLTPVERDKMNECIERDRELADREARAFGAVF